jgi:membrane protein
VVERQPAIERERPRPWSLAAAMIAGFQRHPGGMLSRQAAYSLLYALPAMIALLVSLAAVIDRYTDSGLSPLLTREIDARAPVELQPLLESLVTHAVAEQDGGTAAIGAIVAFALALWGGSGGTSALSYACNRAYDVTDTRPWLQRQLLSIALTLAGGALVIVAFFLVVIGEHVDSWIANRRGEGSDLIALLTSSWLLPGALLLAAVTLLYLLAPDVPVSPRWSMPGAVLASVAALVAFTGFDLIVGLIDPGSAFGAVGSVIVLLWMLDLVSTFVVSGAIVTAVLRKHYDRPFIAWLERHPERRLTPRD